MHKKLSRYFYDSGRFIIEQHIISLSKISGIFRFFVKSSSYINLISVRRYLLCPGDWSRM